MIKIQDDYWTGTECLANEIPWVTPAAVHRLDKLCRPTGNVLDIGSGGSTLFYARRCAKVVAVETNPRWFETVRVALEVREITNVSYHLIQEQQAIEAFLRTLGGFDLISVDSVHGYSRSAFLDIVAGRALKTLVLDNYAEPVLFERHYNKDIADIARLLPASPAGWEGEDFDDAHWCGRGTRILNCL